MNRLYIYILCTLFYTTINAQSLATKGDSAYMNKDYHKAITLYEDALKSEGVSAVILYNLGNTYYKAGNNGKAILCYERALMLDPNDNDIITNLNLVRNNLIDKTVENQSLIVKVWNSIINIFDANTWAWITFVFFIILIGLVSCYLFSYKIKIRKLGFFGGIVSLIMFIFTVLISITSAKKSSISNFAIVIEESTMLSTTPHTPIKQSEEALLLHEGAKVEIIDSVVSSTDSICNIWYDVKINDNRAWIKSTSIEKI